MADFFSAVGAAGNAFVRDVGTAAEGVGNAAREMGGEIAEDFSEVERRYNEEGFGAGTAELVDAMSPGTFVANSLDAVGLLEDEAGKNIVSSMVNLGIACVGPQGLVLAPAAIVSTINDASQIAEAMKATGAKSAAAVAPPMTPEAPKAVAARNGVDTAKGEGRLASNTLRGIGGRELKTAKASEAMITDIMTSAVKLDEDIAAGVVERPAGGFGYGGEFDDILNNPNLTFEEMLFQFMQAVTAKYEEDIKAKLGEIKDAETGGKKPSTTASESTAQPHTGAQSTEPQSEVAAQMLAKAPPAQDNPMVMMGEGLKNLDKEQTVQLLGGVGGSLAAAGGSIGLAFGWTGAGGVVAGTMVGAGAVAGLSAVAVEADAHILIGQALSNAGGGSVHQKVSAQTTAAPAQSAASPTDAETPAADGEGGGESASTKALFAQLEFMTQQYTAMTNAVSNVQKAMHDCSMNSIRNIK